MDPAVILFVILALVVGAVVGWLIGSKQAAAAKEVTDNLRSQLNAVTEERDANRDAATRLAAIQAAQDERDRSYQERLDELKSLETKVETRFSELVGKAVEQAHDAFLKRADEKFGASGKENAAKLETLLQPVQDSLKRYEHGLTEIEKARNDSYGALKEAVAQLAQGNDVVRRETQRLANVMISSPKHRGRWGEEHLKNILESAGLSENIDFELQASVTDGERKLRPDCIINLPSNRCIVVDVKNVWTAFEQAYDEEDPQRKNALLKQHADAMSVCARDLSRKGYWKQFERSPDFVVMFIPGEHILSAAAERAPDMIAEAFKEGVIIASTINMLALAKFFAGMWRQESMAAQAKEIAALGKELHARLQTMGSHVVGLGRNLRLATDCYDDFIGSLDAKVLTQAKRFEDLKVAEGNKPIVDPQRIDFTPKVSTKLKVSPTNDDDDPAQIAAE